MLTPMIAPSQRFTRLSPRTLENEGSGAERDLEPVMGHSLSPRSRTKALRSESIPARGAKSHPGRLLSSYSVS